MALVASAVANGGSIMQPHVLLDVRDSEGDVVDHYQPKEWRRAMASVLGQWVESGEWSAADALRVARMVGADNAKRVYGLAEPACAGEGN